VERREGGEEEGRGGGREGKGREGKEVGKDERKRNPYTLLARM
jgi:hypothetical protein